MDVGTIVAWIQLAIWITVGIGYLFKGRGGTAMPKPILPFKWLEILLIIGFLFSGFSLYTSYHNAPLTEKEWMNLTKTLEQVRNRSFTNQEIELDGKDIRDCTIINATLIYRGKKPFVLDHDNFGGTLAVKITDGPQQNGFALIYLLDYPCSHGTKCDFYAITSDGKPMPPYPP